MPRVLNKQTDKIPLEAIYVGRPSKWGNPWRIGEKHPMNGHKLTRGEVIQIYRQELPQMLKTKNADGAIILDLKELNGKDLVCWCHTWDGKGNNPRFCHADILLELANTSMKEVNNESSGIDKRIAKV